VTHATDTSAVSNNVAHDINVGGGIREHVPAREGLQGIVPGVGFRRESGFDAGPASFDAIDAENDPHGLVCE
jgi:hypothetical protein